MNFLMLHVMCWFFLTKHFDSCFDETFRYTETIIDWVYLLVFTNFYKYLNIRTWHRYGEDDFMFLVPVL